MCHFTCGFETSLAWCTWSTAKGTQAFLHAAAIGPGTTGAAEVTAAGLGGRKPPCPVWKMLMGQGHKAHTPGCPDRR